MPRRRRQTFAFYRMLRATITALVVVFLLGALTVGVALLLVHPNAYKPDIEAAAQRATGRTLLIRGPLHLRFGFPPRLSAEDIVLSGPAGPDRPPMLTLARVEAHVALLPLLARHIVLTDLTLIQPDLLLERDAAGRGNWVMTQAAPPPGAPPPPPVAAPAAAPAPSSRSRFAVGSIRVEQGRIGWRASATAPTTQILLPRVAVDAGGPDLPMSLSGSVSFNDRALRLSGESGPLDALLDPATAAWPLNLTLQDPGARVAVAGTIAEPRRGRGVSLQADIAITDFAGFAPLLPADVTVPHEATLVARWGDGGLSILAAHLGGVRLPKLLPGADIQRIDIDAPAPDRPVHLVAEGIGPAAAPLHLALTTGTLGAILSGGAAPLPLDLSVMAGPASLAVKGSVVTPSAGRGLDLDVAARIPDLAAVGALVGRPLPAARQVAFQGHLTGDADGPGVLRIRGATLGLPQAQLAGDADLRFGGRPSIAATITAPRVDVDALLAAWPASVAPAAAPKAQAEPPKPQPAAAPRWLIPDSPIDFAPLDRLDADLTFRVDQMRAGGVGYTSVAGHALLRDGKLVVDPLSGTTPAGAAEARLSVDARPAEPPLSLFLHAPALQLNELAASVGAPVAASGSVALNADLRGAGRTPHAIAGSLDGRLAIGGADSEVDNLALADLLKLAKLPPIPLNATGSTRLRCAAVGLRFTHGVAAVEPLVLDVGRLTVLAGGSLDFAREEMALQVRPLLRLGGGANAAGIVVPVRLSGPFRDPKAATDLAGGKAPAIAYVGAADPCTPALAAVDAPPPAARAKPQAPAAPAEAAKPESAIRREAATLLDALKALQAGTR